MMYFDVIGKHAPPLSQAIGSLLLTDLFTRLANENHRQLEGTCHGDIIQIRRPLTLIKSLSEAFSSAKRSL